MLFSTYAAKITLRLPCKNSVEDEAEQIDSFTADVPVRCPGSRWTGNQDSLKEDLWMLKDDLQEGWKE